MDDSKNENSLLIEYFNHNDFMPSDINRNSINDEITRV
jgi:hypothetical protein